MAARTNTYNPDYVVSAGAILESYMEAHSLSVDSIAGLCGWKPDVINDILSGNRRIDAEMAERLQKATKVDASLWMNLDINFVKGVKAGRTPITPSSRAEGLQDTDSPGA